VDTKQHDKKYLSARYNTEEDPTDIKTKFVCAYEPEESGAAGLLETIIHGMTAVGLNKEDMNKLSGLTTDGESANTGRKTGLWKRLEEYVGRPILSVWCACDRSDLAMEDLERSIPEDMEDKCIFTGSILSSICKENKGTG
jgi:hypothetical protein